MITVKAPLLVFFICEWSALVTVRILSLSPRSANVIFRSRSDEGREICVAIEKYFHFAFAPPACFIDRICRNPDIHAQESALAFYERKYMKILTDFRFILPVPVSMKVEYRFFMLRNRCKIHIIV